jgi:hypothetical protein
MVTFPLKNQVSSQQGLAWPHGAATHKDIACNIHANSYLKINFL